MKKESPLRKFLSNDGAFDPETRIEYSPGSPGHDQYQKYKDKIKNDNEVGTTNQLEAQISEIIDLIDNAQLDCPSDISIAEQQKVLECRKIQAKTMIRNVLQDVEEYQHAINARILGRKSDNSSEQKDFLQSIINNDQVQQRKHDALIASITSTIRFIAHTFAQISDEAIENWEEKLEEKGEPLLFVKRVRMPERIFLPNQVNLNNRDMIAAWAQQIYLSLAKIKSRLQ